jgi:hypothetical protein
MLVSSPEATAFDLVRYPLPKPTFHKRHQRRQSQLGALSEDGGLAVEAGGVESARMHGRPEPASGSGSWCPCGCQTPGHRVVSDSLNATPH